MGSRQWCGVVIAMGLGIVAATAQTSDSSLPKCAIADFEGGHRFNKLAARQITESFVEVLSQEGQYQIMLSGDRSVTDIEKAIEVGERLGAKYVIYGSTGKLDGRYQLTTYLVDVETGALAKSATTRTRLGRGSFAELVPEANMRELIYGETTTLCNPWFMRIMIGAMYSEGYSDIQSTIAERNGDDAPMFNADGLGEGDVSVIRRIGDHFGIRVGLRGMMNMYGGLTYVIMPTLGVEFAPGRPDTSGLYVDAHCSVPIVETTDDEDFAIEGDGPGFGIAIGYRLNPGPAIQLGYDTIPVDVEGADVDELGGLSIKIGVFF